MPACTKRMCALPEASGALVMSCDQPRLTADSSFARAVAGICRAEPAHDRRFNLRQGIYGIPAVFPRSVYPKLHALHGDKGRVALLVKPPCDACRRAVRWRRSGYRSSRRPGALERELTLDGGLDRAMRLVDGHEDVIRVVLTEAGSDRRAGDAGSASVSVMRDLRRALPAQLCPCRTGCAARSCCRGRQTPQAAPAECARARWRSRAHRRSSPTKR